MTPEEQDRVNSFLLRSLCEIRDRLQHRSVLGGTNIPDLSGAKLMVAVIDESSGMFTVTSEKGTYSAHLHRVLIDAVDRQNEEMQSAA